MGIFRLFLALSVLVWHLWGHAVGPTITGNIAVFTFYMISGFYMSLVINDRYSKMPVWHFYWSRALRLLPTYYAIAIPALCLTVIYGSSTMFNKWIEPTSLAQWAQIIFSNVAIMGLDRIDPNQSMIPVAWTLAIELQFYLVAPFIVTRSLAFCLALLAAALVIRFSVQLGSYTFAPAIWCFFLIGHVSHRLSDRLNERVLRQIGIMAIALLPLLGYLCSVSESLNLDRPQFWIFYLSAAAAIPAIFTLTKAWRIDAFLGELSYPVYISHMLVIGLVMYSWNQHLSFIPYDYHRLICTIAVVIVAVLLHVLIQRPIDVRRKSFGAAARQPILAMRLSTGSVAALPGTSADARSDYPPSPAYP
jgi:peptidoglycan/LPS O-acetylase OafA/YrhL